MADVLKLVFLTNTHEKATLNIPHPDKNLNDQRVKDAMSMIITSGALMIKNAYPVSELSAELQTVTEIPYSV